MIDMENIDKLIDMIKDLRTEISDVASECDGDDYVEDFADRADDMIDEIESIVSDIEDEVKDALDKASETKEDYESRIEDLQDLESDSWYIVGTPTLNDRDKMRLLEAMFDKYTIFELEDIFDNAPSKLERIHGKNQMNLF